MKCRNCGATLDEGALFCRKCGTSVPVQSEPKQKRTAKKTGTSAPADRLSGIIQAIGGFFSGVAAWVKDRFDAVKASGLFKNRRLLMMTGIGAALIVVLIIVIACAASCKKRDRFKTPEALAAAVIETLEKGDGERLREMNRLSETVLGAHPETFGEGDTPEAVMKGYYARLADEISAALSKDDRLEGQLETKIVTDTSIFETNRALDLSATQYAEITGPLSVNGEFVKNIRIVAVELDGKWRPLVVYLY